VAAEVFKAVGNTFAGRRGHADRFRLRQPVRLRGGLLPQFLGGPLASFMSVLGVSVPHYWLGMVLVIVFSSKLMWLPATGAGPAVRVLGLGLGAHAVPDHAGRHHVGDPHGHHRPHRAGAGGRHPVQEFIVGLKARGLSDAGVLRHVVKNAAPTALAVMGLQLGYLLGGSILIETVFSWPGTGFLLNQAIFQRDLPLLQGSILVLALFFVLLNLLVDVLQTIFDPRIERA
jgi:peptide/nickel transport system permease protein